MKKSCETTAKTCGIFKKEKIKSEDKLIRVNGKAKLIPKKKNGVF